MTRTRAKPLPENSHVVEANKGRRCFVLEHVTWLHLQQIQRRVVKALVQQGNLTEVTPRRDKRRFVHREWVQV